MKAPKFKINIIELYAKTKVISFLGFLIFYIITDLYESEMPSNLLTYIITNFNDAIFWVLFSVWFTSIIFGLVVSKTIYKTDKKLSKKLFIANFFNFLLVPVFYALYIFYDLDWVVNYANIFLLIIFVVTPFLSWVLINLKKIKEDKKFLLTVNLKLVLKKLLLLLSQLLILFVFVNDFVLTLTVVFLGFILKYFGLIDKFLKNRRIKAFVKKIKKIKRIHKIILVAVLVLILVGGALFFNKNSIESKTADYACRNVDLDDNFNGYENLDGKINMDKNINFDIEDLNLLEIQIAGFYVLKFGDRYNDTGYNKIAGKALMALWISDGETTEDDYIEARSSYIGLANLKYDQLKNLSKKDYYLSLECSMRNIFQSEPLDEEDDFYEYFNPKDIDKRIIDLYWDKNFDYEIYSEINSLFYSTSYYDIEMYEQIPALLGGVGKMSQIGYPNYVEYLEAKKIYDIANLGYDVRSVIYALEKFYSSDEEYELNGQTGLKDAKKYERLLKDNAFLKYTEKELEEYIETHDEIDVIINDNRYDTLDEIAKLYYKAKELESCDFLYTHLQHNPNRLLIDYCEFINPNFDLYYYGDRNNRLFYQKVYDYYEEYGSELDFKKWKEHTSKYPSLDNFYLEEDYIDSISTKEYKNALEDLESILSEDCILIYPEGEDSEPFCFG